VGTQLQPTPALPLIETQTHTSAIKVIPCPAVGILPLSRKDTDGTKIWGEDWNRTYTALCGDVR
jgi:hypothetical protein